MQNIEFFIAALEETKVCLCYHFSYPGALQVFQLDLWTNTEMLLKLQKQLLAIVAFQDDVFCHLLDVWVRIWSENYFFDFCD